MNKLFLLLSAVIICISSVAFGQNNRMFQSFESPTFPPTGWQRISVLGANQWTRVTAPLTASFGTNNAKDGSAVAFINFQAPLGEDWLISNKINNMQAGDSLRFFIIKQYSDGPYPYDSLIVKVSTTDSALTSFTQVAGKICVDCLPIGAPEIIWRKFTFSLSQFAGQNIYLAFQHKDSDGHGIVMDSVAVFNNLTGVTPVNGNIPTEYALKQNYPNPFNPTTNISFDLPKSGFTTLKVYDILGNEVATMINSELNAGSYSYNFNGANLSSGVYYYRLESNGFLSTQKMTLVK